MLTAGRGAMTSRSLEAVATPALTDSVTYSAEPAARQPNPLPAEDAYPLAIRACQQALAQGSAARARRARPDPRTRDDHLGRRAQRRRQDHDAARRRWADRSRQRPRGGVGGHGPREPRALPAAGLVPARRRSRPVRSADRSAPARVLGPDRDGGTRASSTPRSSRRSTPSICASSPTAASTACRWVSASDCGSR